VLALPPRNNDSQYLLDQLCHGRPLLGGYLARLPDYPLVRGSSALQGLWYTEALGPDIVQLDTADELAALGVRYVILDRTQLPRGAQVRLHDSLTSNERIYESNALIVYAVTPREAAVVTLGDGWHAAESDDPRTWRWMGERAEIRTIARQSTPAAFSLRATAFGQDRPLEIWQGSSLLGQWTIPAAPYDQVLQLDLLLPSGVQTFQLRSSTANHSTGRALSLSISDVRLAARSATLPTAPVAIPPTLPAPTSAPCG
jgi:hypothetical protein